MPGRAHRSVIKVGPSRRTHSVLDIQKRTRRRWNCGAFKTFSFLSQERWHVRRRTGFFVHMQLSTPRTTSSTHSHRRERSPLRRSRDRMRERRKEEEHHGTQAVVAVVHRVSRSGPAPPAGCLGAFVHTIAAGLGPIENACPVEAKQAFA